MFQQRLGLKALTLCALVLGLMTFGLAGVAQAETGSVWDVLDSKGTLIKIPGTNDLLPEIGVEIEPSTLGILEFTTGGGTLVEFKCEAVQLNKTGGGRPTLGANGSLAAGKATFTKCSTFLNGKAAGSCEAKSKEQPNGTIQTEEADGLIVLGAGGVPLVLILPLVKNKAGEPLGAIIETGELCAIGAKVEVTGHLDIGDCEGKFTTHLAKHLIIEPAGFRLLKALGKPASVLGSAFAFLEGAHEKLLWSGLPA